jgi:diaminohydroxyphosphoribosylaminopyrimidine deaminase / 5-amino-6-(5-phosphoribosylamino)uracil reductase
MTVRASEDAVRHMRRALALAARGRGRTRPNPMVGAVLVRNGDVVGEGWHRAAGQDHAEVMALRQAGERARGATLYVTLEPCAHWGRTPPCVDAIVLAGVRRCVVALRDPHAIVDGRGLRRLRRAGIAVETGLLADEARTLLRGYMSAHRRGRPHVTWKVAATLDGRIADRRGRARWITGAAARARGHRMRAHMDAIVVGATTARRDDPRLDARGVGAAAQPLRVVCDTSLALPLSLRLFGRARAAGTAVACGPKAPPARRRALEARGVRVWALPLAGGRVSPRALAARLAAEGCHEVMLEGGAALGTSWMACGLVDEVALFLAPRLIGAEGLDWCGALGRRGLADAVAGRVLAHERVGDDVLVRVGIGG